MFGFINIYKSKGITSHDVISFLRKKLKIKRIGHAGTLDPLAEGVLPVAIGNATRLLEYLQDGKEYEATVKFGESTTTYDCEGEVTFKSDKVVSLFELENALENFKGEIFQAPPMYSAIKKNGKRLYEYAREGKTIEVEPRKVFIEKLDLISFENNVAVIRVKCSKGTYIRSIAHDLGEVLKCGAHLIKLVRTCVGDFDIKSAVMLEDFENTSDYSCFIKYPLEFLTHFKAVNIDDLEYQKVIYGQKFFSQKFTNCNNELIILIYCNKMVAVTRIIEGKTFFEKVFIS